MRNPNNAAIFVKLHSDPKYMKLHAAKDAAKAADALATKAAIAEVNRAINVAYYNGIL